MKIYVSQLAADVTDADLRMLFECFGQVASVEMGKIPGSALVEMPDKVAAREAVIGLNGQELKGRDLLVEEARKRAASRGPQRNKRPRRRSRRR